MKTVKVGDTIWFEDQPVTAGMVEKAIAKFIENHHVDRGNTYPFVVGDTITVDPHTSRGAIWVRCLVDNGRSREERGAGYFPSDLAE